MCIILINFFFSTQEKKKIGGQTYKLESIKG